MLHTVENGYSSEAESYEEVFAETPFAIATVHEQEQALETSAGETLTGNWEYITPFLPGESTEAEGEGLSPEAGEFSEITAELKDTLFRESLEQLADEALDAHSEQLAGEYGDRETRDLSAERLLNAHFEPLASEAEALLDRFFERMEGYRAESLTDLEIERISGEVPLTAIPMSPASEQFLGGLLRKAGKLVSGAVNLAKKGLAAVGKFALGPILQGLKKLGRFLLTHVVKNLIGRLPVSVQPLAQQLADRLYRALGETHEGEIEGHEQTESEGLPAAPDTARMEAEFDVNAAQLLFTPDEAEIEHLISSYGESEDYSSAADLDSARAQLVKELSRLQPGESAQPAMEQFIPLAVGSLWPIAKTAISLIGRPKVVSFIGRLLAGLMKNLIGPQGAALLGPAIADVGLRFFGFEAGEADPRTAVAEALAATAEETIHAVAEMPPHVLENETLLSEAVQEAFENAAASYFPNSAIKPELRESTEQHGMWARMPAESDSKRYAKYSDTIPVDVSPKVAGSVKTFGNATLADHLRDQHGHPEGRNFKGNVTLYQALPGTRGSTIARAEGFPVSQLHPLTPHAAGALLGPNAALGNRHTSAPYTASPQKLHVGQRLYRIHPPGGRHHHHVRPIHSELLINLLRGEIRIWLYLSEPLCQRIAADLSKGTNVVAAFKRLKPLIRRTGEALKLAISHHHLPPEILVVSETPNLDGKVHHWLRQAGHHLAHKIGEWADVQIAQYLRGHAEEFKRACASRHDGLTLRITMTRVPGLDLLRRMSEGKAAKHFSLAGWPQGSPAFHVAAHPGFAINRLRG
jgi:hypothetical protein